jgi:lipopolysaccharide transport system ATP-binding protein
MKPVISFEHVSKKYNLGVTRTSLPNVVSQQLKRALKRAPQISRKDEIIWAVRDLSFEVGQGESLALIGPNGAGKTTTLKLLANITKPTSGRIETNGQLSALIELGAGFHPDLTGGENIYLNGTILGLTRKDIKRRFDEIVEFSELERFIDTPVKRYSSGMTVRLGFAVAACIGPDILLVDEVLAVGDASFRQKCVKRIQELLDRGTSIVFVSHNLWLVQAVCSTAIYIDKGEIKYSGQTSKAIELYDRALNEERARKFEILQSGQGSASTGIEITKIEVVGEDSRASDDLRNDQSAEVRVRYVAFSEAEVTIVVRIIRSDGLTCCMMRTGLDNVQVSLKPGTGVVSVVLDPLQLRGGKYYVEAMIRDASDSEGIANSISDWFYVSGSAMTFHEMNGVFEPRRRWNHYQISSEASVLAGEMGN